MTEKHLRMIVFVFGMVTGCGFMAFCLVLNDIDLLMRHVWSLR